MASSTDAKNGAADRSHLWLHVILTHGAPRQQKEVQWLPLWVTEWHWLRLNLSQGEPMSPRLHHLICLGPRVVGMAEPTTPDTHDSEGYRRPEIWGALFLIISLHHCASLCFPLHLLGGIPSFGDLLRHRLPLPHRTWARHGPTFSQHSQHIAAYRYTFCQHANIARFTERLCTFRSDASVSWITWMFCHSTAPGRLVASTCRNTLQFAA